MNTIATYQTARTKARLSTRAFRLIAAQVLSLCSLMPASAAQLEPINDSAMAQLLNRLQPIPPDDWSAKEHWVYRGNAKTAHNPVCQQLSWALNKYASVPIYNAERYMRSLTMAEQSLAYSFLYKFPPSGIDLEILPIAKLDKGEVVNYSIVYTERASPVKLGYTYFKEILWLGKNSDIEVFAAVKTEDVKLSKMTAGALLSKFAPPEESLLRSTSTVVREFPAPEDSPELYPAIALPIAIKSELYVLLYKPRTPRDREWPVQVRKVITDEARPLLDKPVCTFTTKLIQER